MKTKTTATNTENASFCPFKSLLFGWDELGGALNIFQDGESKREMSASWSSFFFKLLLGSGVHLMP